MEFRIQPPTDALKDHLRYFWVWENGSTDVPQAFRTVASVLAFGLAVAGCLSKETARL